MNKLKYPILFLLLVVFLNSSDSLSYKNEILSSLPPCCNWAMCNAAPCSSQSSIGLKSSACEDDIILTCYQCIYYSARGEVCNDPVQTYCILADGTRYYGDENPTKGDN